MHWQKLDRDTSAAVINSVKSDANAGLFSVTTSEVKRARLACYKEYYIYNVTNYASLPSFTFEFLGDGTFFHHLDGTEYPIHTVNDKGALSLDKNNVMEYLNFYFTYVSDDDGDIVVVNNPNDMPLLGSLDTDAYNAVIAQHKPTEIHYDGGFDAYEIETDLYKDAQLVRANIEVSTKGRVSVKYQKMTMNEVVDSSFPEAIM